MVREEERNRFPKACPELVEGTAPEDDLRGAWDGTVSEDVLLGAVLLIDSLAVG
jgi:hypothetical protein